MRYLSATLAAVIGSAVLAETVINYDDGSQYTLLPSAAVYVSPNELFNKQEFLNTRQVVFTPIVPNRRRDYVNVTSPSDGLTPGSPEWCALYVPFQDGYTFSDQVWQKSCRSS